MNNSDILFFDFNQKSSTLLIFFFNAVVFSILLFKQGFKEDQKTSKWLGLFILLCGFYVCPFMLGYAGWYSIKRYREFMFFVPFQQVFLIGPVLYFYTRSLLNKDFHFNRSDLLHFAPAAIYALYTIVVFITDKLMLNDFYFYADGRDKDLDFWYQMSGLLSMLGYLLLCLFHYRKYKRFIEQEVSYAEEIRFRWIKNFFLAFALILVLRVLFFIFNPEWAEFGRKYWYYLSFSAVCMYIIIEGYSNSLKLKSKLTTTNISLSEPPPDTKEYLVETVNDPSMIESSKKELERLIHTKKIHTNPQLTLNDVASELGTNRNLVSITINQGFQMNFNDYINSKRIETVIQEIKNGTHLEKTLLGIALESGFNSKSTFNRAFKKNTSLTPKQYIDKNQL